MTTIAWDGYVLAADSLEERGNYISSRSIKKIREKNGVFYAITGTHSIFDALIEWHQNDAVPDKMPKISDDNSSILIAIGGGECYAFYTDLPYPDRIYPPMAFGSGWQFAIGAMKNGATAEEAVRIAIDCDTHTDSGIHSVATLKFISSDLENENVLEQINKRMNAKAGSAEGVSLEQLAKIVEEYEEKRYGPTA